MKVNDVEICVDTLGDPANPAVLLIAGAASSMDWWRQEFLERLASAGRYVIRYDTRDTGQSESYPPGAPGYTFSDLVDDAVGVLDAVGVPSAQVVGISMGGALAQLVTLQHPERVDSLVLIATSSVSPGNEELPGMTDDLRAFFADHTPPDYTDRDAMVENTVTVLGQFEGPQHFDAPWVRSTAAKVFDRTRNMASSEQNHMRMAESETPEFRVGDIAAPTLVIHGTVDPLFPLPHGQSLTDQIPGARLLPIDGMGHQPPPPATWDLVVPAMLGLGQDR